MAHPGRFTLLLLVAVLLASGCRPVLPALGASLATEASVTAALGRLTYDGIILYVPITLTGGRSEYRGSGTGMPYVELVDSLNQTGNLDDDGKLDAAAILVNHAYDSAGYAHLVGVLDVLGNPAPIEALFLGDRTQVRSVTIRDGRITVEMVGSYFGDRACCPSRTLFRHYAVANGELVELSSEDRGALSVNALDGTSWRLIDNPWTKSGEYMPAGLTFANGQISSAVYCNSLTANYEADAAQPQGLRIDVPRITLVGCFSPPGPLTFDVGVLAEVTSWRYEGENLVLIYRASDGTMSETVWEPVPPW